MNNCIFCWKTDSGFKKKKGLLMQEKNGVVKTWNPYPYYCDFCKIYMHEDNKDKHTCPSMIIICCNVCEERKIPICLHCNAKRSSFCSICSNRITYSCFECTNDNEEEYELKICETCNKQ